MFSYASPRLCDKDKEHFIRKQQFSDTGNAWRFEYMIILLDSKNKVIKDEIVPIGAVSRNTYA